MKLTKTAIDKLALPASGYALHWDDDLPGFGIRVTATGVKAFIVQQRIHGKDKRITVGRFGALTAEQARKQAKALIGEIATGGDPVADKARKKLEAVTLKDAFKGYTETRKTLKAGTVADMERIMREAFEDWQDRKLTAITRDMVAKRHKALGARSEARANLAMRYLRAIFNFAAAEYTDAEGRPVVTENPVKKLSETRAWYRVARRQTVIKPHQLKPWMQAVFHLPNEYARDYFMLLLLTGLRRSEGLGLQWKDVDLDGRTLTVHEPKNHRDHTLPLSDFLLDMLRKRKAESERHAREARTADDAARWTYIFETPRGRLQNLRFAQEEIEKASGIPFCPHDLRRTFATVADSLDIPGYAVKALLNHKNGADVTAGYIVADVERLRRPMQRITDYMLAAGGVREGAEVIELSGKSVATKNGG